MPTRLAVAVVLLWVMSIVPPLAGTQTLPVDDVAARMAAYVTEFTSRFSNVVATETYEQRYRGTNDSGSLTRYGSLTRQLTSDFLLVRAPLDATNWMVFRDVLIVDGMSVRNQPDRILRLFADSARDAAERAAKLNYESAKFHLPGTSALVTNPLLVVALMHPHYQAGLRFRLGNEERSMGPGVRVVQFEEVRNKLTAEQRRSGKWPSVLGDGATIRGNVWVEPQSGRILKTEGRIEVSGTTSTTITMFARDDRLSLTVPIEMRTTWVFTDGNTLGGTVNGVAKYGNFRRFDVKTDTSIDPPQ